jgi:hypothetical protein
LGGIAGPGCIRHVNGGKAHHLPVVQQFLLGDAGVALLALRVEAATRLPPLLTCELRRRDTDRGRRVPACPQPVFSTARESVMGGETTHTLTGLNMPREV